MNSVVCVAQQGSENLVTVPAAGWQIFSVGLRPRFFFLFWPYLPYSQNFSFLHSIRMASFCEASHLLSWGWPHFVRSAPTCMAGFIQPKLILDLEALGLTTEAWPHTAGCAVLQFMSAWPAVLGGAWQSLKKINPIVWWLRDQQSCFNSPEWASGAKRGARN